jgi:hypothetical protein
MLNSQASSAKKIIEGQLIVRINGTLPDISTLGSEEKSERAAEVKRQGISTNTSCSLFARVETDQKIFHILVDVGQGIVNSIEKGTSDLGFNSSSFIPDALLITHSHDDHIKELPMLVNKVDDSLLSSVFAKPTKDYAIDIDPIKDNQNLFNTARLTVTNAGKLPLTNIVVNYGGNSDKTVEKLASLSPGEKVLLSPPEGSTLQSVTVTADHGVSVTKAYRTPIKIPGMMGS